MLTYEVSNTGEKSVTVDGLGVLSAGQTMIVSDEARKQFENTRGLTLAQARMPEGVAVTVGVIGKEENE
jgi:hypothetical protein